MFCNVVVMEDTCRVCGMPIEFDKSEGPTTALPFLSIELRRYSGPRNMFTSA